MLESIPSIPVGSLGRGSACHRPQPHFKCTTAWKPFRHDSSPSARAARRMNQLMSLRPPHPLTENSEKPKNVFA